MHDEKWLFEFESKYINVPKNKKLV